MYRQISLAAMTILLVGCTEPYRAQTAMEPAPVVVIRYQMSDLPMSEMARFATIMNLAQLTSAAFARACTQEEREYLELKIILGTVDYEEWRTAPWSAKQKAEVRALRKRWQELGGESRSLSSSCKALVK